MISDNTKMNDEPNVNDSVILLMKAHNMNDNSLADAINEVQGEGVASQPQIRRITRKESKSPRGDTLRPIAIHFGVSLAQLGDFEFIKSLVDSGNATPKKTMMIREINSLLLLASEDDCAAILHILER